MREKERKRRMKKSRIRLEYPIDKIEKTREKERIT